MDKPVNFAIAYAQMGVFVFPCRLDKKPITAHGFLDATMDVNQIANWWAAHPDASIGAACGATKWLVLDVDKDKGGYESFDALMANGILQPDDLNTLTSKTGGGGMHMIWFQPEGVSIKNNAGKLGHGLDVRGEGGYIILPPSGHPSGTAYEWRLYVEPRVAPQKLVTLLLEQKKEERPFTAPANPKGAIKSAIGKIAHASRGERNNVLSEQAWFLLHLVKDGSLPKQVALDALKYAAQQVGLSEREIDTTLQSKVRLVLGG